MSSFQNTKSPSGAQIPSAYKIQGRRLKMAAFSLELHQSGRTWKQRKDQDMANRILLLALVIAALSCSGSALTWQNYAIPSVGSRVVYKTSEYPYAYKANTESGLRVTSPAGSRIEIVCGDFDVEYTSGCVKDGMKLGFNGETEMQNFGAYCGWGKLNETSKTNALTIYFFSGTRNIEGNYRWSCEIKAIDATTSASGTSAVTTTAAPTTTTIRTTTTTTTPVPTTTRTTTTTTTLRTTTKATTTAAPKCQCGVRQGANTRIVNGTTAGLHEFPWRCALYNPGEKGLGIFCGASVISANWIMTAAHCTNALKTSGSQKLQVDCGEHDLGDAAEAAIQLIDVDGIAQHESYNNKTQDNDISLLHLAEPLEFDETVSPICLPWKSETNGCESGATVTASGWGTTSSGGDGASALQKVDLPCMSSASCRSYYPRLGMITDNMICTYQQYKDTCQGDSGGSVDYNSGVNRYVAVGIVSWGVGCAGKDKPGVYARVDKYLDWIQSTTNENFCKP